jgi:chromosome transmission fidelity protein 1
LRFCDETQLEKKLMGFNEKYSMTKQENDENTSENNNTNTPKKILQLKTPRTPSSPATSKKSKIEQKEIVKETDSAPLMKSPFMQIKQLLRVLSTPLYDGRILLNIDQTTRSTLKYILLNPSVCFEDIVTQAHSVILAGGTMKPVIKFFFI